MSEAAAVGWTLLRSVLVMLAGTALSAAIARGLGAVRRPWAVVGWSLLLAPLFTPSLVVGYCYRDTSLALVHHPQLRSALYAGLVLAQAAPVGVLLLWFAPPPPVTDAALHARSLFRPRGVSPVWLWLRSRSRSLLPAAALLFVLTFQEADLASLLQAASWTEWLFTNYVGGMRLEAAVRSAVLPGLLQLPLLLPLLVWLGDGSTASSPRRSSGAAKWAVGIGGVWILGAFTAVTLLPFGQLLRGARQGWPVLWEQPATLREIGDALLLSVTSGGLAMVAAAGLLQLASRSAERHPDRQVLTYGSLLVVLLPGLIGTLALGLGVAAIFQTPPLRPAYNSPIPLILAEMWYLLPRAVIVLCCLHRARPEAGAHVVRLLADSPDPGQQRAAARLWWRMTGRLWLGAAVLIGLWSYLEVMLPSLLAMPGMAPVGRVLYDSLHYGRISGMAAKLMLSLLAPVASGLAVFFLYRLLLRFR